MFVRRAGAWAGTEGGGNWKGTHSRDKGVGGKLGKGGKGGKRAAPVWKQEEGVKSEAVPLGKFANATLLKGSTDLDVQVGLVEEAVEEVRDDRVLGVIAGWASDAHRCEDSENEVQMKLFQDVYAWVMSTQCRERFPEDQAARDNLYIFMHCCTEAAACNEPSVAAFIRKLLETCESDQPSRTHCHDWLKNRQVAEAKREYSRPGYKGPGPTTLRYEEMARLLHQDDNTDLPLLKLAVFPPKDSDVLDIDQATDDLLGMARWIMKRPLPESAIDDWRAVQHRLMMHDVYVPLRNGIKQQLEGKGDKPWILKHHRSVRFTSKSYTPDDGVTYTFESHFEDQRNTSRYANFGNLCVLTPAGKRRFQPGTLLYGYITDKIEGGKKGKGKDKGGKNGKGDKGGKGSGDRNTLQFSLRLDPISQKVLSKLDRATVFEIVESKADYRTTRMVIEILSGRSGMQPAMEVAVVTGNTKLPRYLQNVKSLDIKGVLDKERDPHPTGSTASELSGSPKMGTYSRLEVNDADELVFAMETVSDDSNDSTDHCHKLEVNDADELGFAEEQESDKSEETSGHCHTLDPSQEHAMLQAMVKNVAIIQGPPGTGKTFIGAKIVQLLHHNRLRIGLNMIYVVCLTNHALDSFLEDILQFVPRHEVLRFGNRIKGDVEDLTLKHKQRNDWKHPRFVGHAKYNCYRLQERLKEVCDTEEELSENPFSLGCVNDPGEERQTEVQDRDWDRLSEITTQYWELVDTARQAYRAAQRTLSQATSALTKEEESKDLLVEEEESIRSWLWERPLWHIQELDYIYESWLGEKINLTASVIAPPQYPPTSFTRAMEGWCSETKSLLDTSPVLRRHRAAVVGQENVVAACLFTFLCAEEDVKSCSEALEDLREAGALRWWAYHMQDTDEGEWEECEEEEEEESRCLDDYEQAQLVESRDVGARFGIFDTRLMSRDSRIARSQRMKVWRSQYGVPLGRWRQESRVAFITDLAESYRADLQSEQQRIIEQLAEREEEYKMVRHYDTLRIVQEHFIVAATTAGAAMYLPVMREAKPKVVMAEEAAEVPESHILACLTSSVDQVFLIGDHQQLQPKVTSMDRTTENVMGISMMERLAALKDESGDAVLPYGTLNVQRRMHPEIAKFTKPYYVGHTIEDHETTTARVLPFGVKDNRRVLFVTHNIDRKPGDSMAESPYSMHEAEFAVLVAQYLTMQPGTSPHGITLLTPYAGQLMKLMDQAKQKGLKYATKQGSLEGVRIASIDDYQGEENDFVVISLVRDNEISGFMRKDNRACVALSRAKRGMYVVCHERLPELFQREQGDSVWRQAMELAREEGCFHSGGFPAYCAQHSTNLAFSDQRSYQAVGPHGGCKQVCGVPLPCDHPCPMMCHPHLEGEHVYDKHCARSTTRMRPNCNHDWTQPCWKWTENVPLPPCPDGVLRTLPGCNHQQALPCHVDYKTHRCAVPLTKPRETCPHDLQQECWRWKERYPLPDCTVHVHHQLDCSHPVTLPCHFDVNDYECKVKVKQLHPGCRHSLTQACWRWVDGTPLPPCNEDVTRTLPCGHKKNFKCCDAAWKEHVCHEPHERELPCGHKCTQACHLWSVGATLPPCKARVERELSCGHHHRLRCHIDPATVQCEQEREERRPECRHPYTQSCWKWTKGVPRPDCHEMVEHVLSCKHTVSLKCFVDISQHKCSALMTKLRDDCSHPCTQACWQWHEGTPLPACQVLTPLRLPNCSHTMKLPCSADTSTRRCMQLCTGTREGCGHSYEQECWKWVEGEKLPPCNTIEKRALACGHEVSLKCFIDVGSHQCLAVCDIRYPQCPHTYQQRCCDSALPPPLCLEAVESKLPCGHKLKRKCSDPQKCTVVLHQWEHPCCGHTFPNVECWRLQDPSDWPVCTQPITRKYESCAHKASGHCGDSLPPQCLKQVTHTCRHNHQWVGTCSDPRCTKQVQGTCAAGHPAQFICSDGVAPPEACAECMKFPLDINSFKQDPHLVDVPRGSAEFHHVEGCFRATMAQQLARVQKVYNKAQWDRFKVNRDIVEKKGRDPNIKQCFHGTRELAPSTVWSSAEGFDPTHSKAGVWGQAAYFAVNSSYSQGYASRVVGGQQMFLADVLVGRSVDIPGNSGLRQPPTIPGSAVERYDSVTGQTGGSTVHMVYYTGLAYPKYLLTY